MAKLAYLGSPGAAVSPLRALVDAGHEICLVVSQPDKRRGRGSSLVPSPVKAAACDLGLAVSDALDDVMEVGAELGVVVAYGRLIPARILNQLDMINLHFSLLPRWRGAAPVERAILAGDTRTGVCLMRLEQGLDTGPVLGCETVSIGPHEHASSLFDRMSKLGVLLLVEALKGGVDLLGPGTAQVGEPSYAAKLEPGEFRLDWNREAELLERVVRLDRAWSMFRGQRLRVLDALSLSARGKGQMASPGHVVGDAVACGSGLLQLLSVQPEGKRPMDFEQWSRGARLSADDQLL